MYLISPLCRIVPETGTFMLLDLPGASAEERYSLGEIALAAGVPVGRASRLARGQGAVGQDRLVDQQDAVRLVKILTRRPLSKDEKPAIGLIASAEGRRRLPLVISGAVHTLVILALIGATSLGLLRAKDELSAPPLPQTHLVYLVALGPGGGGGGGGLQVPAPPPKAQLASPVKKRVSSPVPPPVRRPPPPRPPVVIERPTPAPPPPRPVERPIPVPDPPKPAPAPPAPVAPVATVAADLTNKPGLPVDSAAQAASPGPGTGGGIGSGAGTGLGEGRGAGIGDGSGGGTGGGSFHPGTGVEPPSLLHEVKADYTDDARRRAIEGSVRLEIVVRRDGKVGDIKVLETLGGGLERKAIDAVRQWRFAPAKRLGAAVDVVVDVSVDFKLR